MTRKQIHRKGEEYKDNTPWKNLYDKTQKMKNDIILGFNHKGNSFGTHPWVPYIFIVYIFMQKYTNLLRNMDYQA